MVAEPAMNRTEGYNRKWRRRRLTVSPEAAAGDVSALLRDAREAGWIVRIRQRGPRSPYLHTVEICLRQRRELYGAPPRTDPATGEWEEGDSWRVNDRLELWAFARTANGACAQIADAVSAYYANLDSADGQEDVPDAGQSHSSP